MVDGMVILTSWKQMPRKAGNSDSFVDEFGIAVEQHLKLWHGVALVCTLTSWREESCSTVLPPSRGVLTL